MQQKLYALLREIPKGRVTTYGALARALGNQNLCRAVGAWLHQNPDGEANPCYKVVNAKGFLSRAYAFGGADVQKEKLERDGIKVVNGRVDLTKFGWKPD